MIEKRALTVGVEVLGLDLARVIDPGVAQELRNLMARHQLLVFRDQSLCAADQIRVCELFGNVLDEKEDGLRYQYVSGEKASVSPGRLLFHSDNHHTQVPLEYLALYAESVDDAATPTLFVNSIDAYRRLPPTLRNPLEDAETVTMTFFHLAGSGKPSWTLGDDNAGGPTARHPAIWRHPQTGEPFAFITELHTNHVVGLPRAESDRLLAEVFYVMYQPDSIYEHRWHSGDLIVWNNRTVQHARGEIADPAATGTAPRNIRRVGMGPISFSEQFRFSDETLKRIGAVPGNFYTDPAAEAASRT